MSLSYSLSSFVGSAVSQVAPQTGHAVSAAITTVTAGDLAGVGHGTDTLINAMGTDTTNSTILHGAAQTVTNLSATGVSGVLEPIATGPLGTIPSALATAAEPAVALLVPHIGPASAILIDAAGSGHVASVGHALDGMVNATGADISQSTVLHGAAGLVTTLTVGAPDSFHFPAPAGGGADTLSGLLSGSTVSGLHVADLSSAASVGHVDASHTDLPLLEHNPLADLAHATHHA